MSDDDTCKLDVHKLELLFLDHDDLGAQRAKELFEQTRYPNHIIPPTVLSCETKTIDYNDDHPLNKRDRDTKIEAASKLFGAKLALTPEQLEALGRLWTMGLFMKAMVMQLRAEAAGGEVRLAVIVMKPDKTGRIGPSWEADTFFNDLDALKGIHLP